MRHYTQLTKDQRYQISAFLETGYSQSEIAKEIRKSKSTISRELKRNSGRRGYRPLNRLIKKRLVAAIRQSHVSNQKTGK